MKLIKPSEVSSKIMTLIEESEEKIILISPYVKVAKWYKLVKKIEEAKKRNIDIEFYIREDNGENNSQAEVIKLGLIPIEIKDLHCKLYMNEKKAVMTSMNLLLSSEINSLELGYETESKDEYSEIYDFYKRYISKHSEKEAQEDDSHWLDLLVEKCSKDDKKLKIYCDQGQVELKTTHNTYSVFIWTEKNKNLLRINGILSGKEFNLLDTNKDELSKKIGMQITGQEGRKGHYDLIWGTSVESFGSCSVLEVPISEYEKISTYVFNFIYYIDNYKVQCKRK